MKTKFKKSNSDSSVKNRYTPNSRLGYKQVFLYLILLLPSILFSNTSPTIEDKSNKITIEDFNESFLVRALVSSLASDDECTDFSTSIDYLPPSVSSKVLYQNSEAVFSMRMAEEKTCRRVFGCDADAEQFLDGGNLVICTDGNISDLDLGQVGSSPNQTALNFEGWSIPSGSTIISATIQFTSIDDRSGAANFTIYGEDTDNAPAYTVGNDVISRPLTTASVAWTPGAWVTDGTGIEEETPDLTAIVQEIIDRPGYITGNNLAFHITGTGTRRAYSTDLNIRVAPRLCIVYDAPPEEPEPECTACPEVSIASLDGVPNFPVIDLLNICSAPDTASLLIYNPAECDLSNINLEIVFDEGLFYGGFIFVDSNSSSLGTVGIGDLTNPVKPVFTISEIEAGATMIINFGVKADCGIDSRSEEDINFDANISYAYSGGSAGEVCTVDVTEVGAYNSGIKEPVINVLSVSPEELEIQQSSTAMCQTITLSQDGISAFLDQFQFVIRGLDQSLFTLTNISVNGITVPPTDYVYNAATQSVSMTVTGNYFPGNFHTGANGDNFFDTDERLNIEVCYMVESCIEDANFLMYQAFYGCNGEICGDISEMQGALEFKPDFAANLVAVSSFINYGAVCGDNLEYELIVESTNNNPLDGLWKDLVIKYKGCVIANTSIEILRLNGVVIPNNLWTAENETIIIDLTANTVDFDGPGGISDEDNDGFFDDLEGDQSITIYNSIDIGCGDSSADCSNLACSLNQVEVNGVRNCGQDFQDFATIGGDGPVNFFYGNQSTNTNVVTTPGFGTPITEVVVATCDVWNPTVNGYEFDYTFGQNNITECVNSGGIELIVTVVGNGSRLRDIRYTDASATYQSNAVAGTTSQYITIPNSSGGVDTTALEIRIPAGDNSVVDHAYFFNLDYRGGCYTNDIVDLTYKVVEICNSCDPVGCEIVRACENAATYFTSSGCLCECDIRGYIDTIQRTNYGFADKEMTLPLTAEDVPEADRTRFLPGDTMYYRVAFEFLDASVLYEDVVHHYWQFYVNPREESGPVMLDVYNSYFGGWFWENSATGEVTEIGVPDCLQQYPDSTRDAYRYPSIELRNMGVENKTEAWASRADDAYQTCLDSENINPNYPPESVYNYMMTDDDFVVDDATDRQRIMIFWGQTDGCQDMGLNSDGSADDGVNNNCREAFLQQFPIQDGDIVYFDMYAPVVHNPAYDLNILNGTGKPITMQLDPVANIYGQTETCGVFDIASFCFSSGAFDGHLPGPMSVVPDVVVEDCDIEVEYTFTLQNPLPTVSTGELPWYENEYRPYMATEYLEFAFPNNMIYTGDGMIVMPDGSEVPFPQQYIDQTEGNLACVDNGTGGICCVAADGTDLAAMRFVDQDYIRGKEILSASENEILSLPGTSTDLCDSKALVHVPNDPFPHIPVGGQVECLSYGLKYTLSALCPEDVESGDFQLEYQFSEPYIPNLVGLGGGVYRGSFGDFANGIEFPESYRNLFENNPFGTLCGLDGADDGCIAFYDRIFPHPVGSTGSSNPMRQQGTQVTNPDQFTDNSLNYPPLIPSIANLLKADAAGMSETNTYTVCAGTVGGGATHTNVVTSIDVPNSVEFIGVEDGSGNVLTWELAQTLPESKVYAVSLPDLAPGACTDVVIETELLFCPVGLDVDTEICIATVSGCIDPIKAAAISAVGGACDMVSACYQYIAEEADIQAEWDPQPMGPYNLCEVIPAGIRIKNVKPAVLIDITHDFWLSSGLEFVSGSFRACYPGGPGNTGPCVTIPDPVRNPAMDNIFGENYGYDDASLWNSFIDQNGLPGILSDADSNRVQILFDLETVCDDFISGTSAYYQTSGADPCESRVSSMFVNSNAIIIEGADPRDFAQFFVFADPVEANCGDEATLNLTYLNISPLGESLETIACLELETSTFDYTSGSATWVSPTTHNPMITEEVNGIITKVCFTIPDGIGPGEAFVLSLDFQVPEDMICGVQDLGVKVSSEIMGVNCVSDGSECNVNVLNSVNPVINVEFLPPLDIDNQHLISQCPNVDGTVDVCYSIELSNGNQPYNDDIIISLYQDLNRDSLIDTTFEPVLGTATQNINLSVGGSQIIEGCFTITEGASCPSVLRIEQTSSCVCNSSDYPYNSIEPDVLQGIEPEITLCPNVPFALANCGSWTYLATPSNGATFTPNAAGDSIYVYINSGFGVSSPVNVTVSSAIGGCSPFEVELSLYSLELFNFGPYEGVDACNVGCTNLGLGLPPDYESNVIVQWSPTTYLDDPTSLTPMICNPQNNITYTVDLTFTFEGNTCDFSTMFPVNIIDQPTENTITDSDLCPGLSSTITAPGGFSSYEWMRLNSDGTTTTVELGSSNTFMPTSAGSYVVEYSNFGDICTTRSNIFDVSTCIDYGDLPDSGIGTSALNYETSVANDGAGHTIIEGLSLGTAVDEEADGQPSIDALGDGADEDGITFPPNLQWVPGGTVILPFSVTNNSGAQAELEIWIDWNGDGDFNDPNEFVIDLSDDLTGNFDVDGNLVIDIPEDIATDQPLGVRARLSNEDDMTPYGLVSSGEVEDYLITVNCTTFQCQPMMIQINK